MIKPLAAPAARAGSAEIRPYADGLDASSSVWKAVLAGLAIYLGSMLVVIVIPAMGYGFYLADSGVPRDEARAALVSLAFSPWFYVPAVVLGAAVSWLCGYNCARMAGGAALRAGIILAALTVVLGLLSSDDALFPWWASGLDIVLTAGAVMLGVRYGRARRQ